MKSESVDLFTQFLKQTRKWTIQKISPLQKFIMKKHRKSREKGLWTLVLTTLKGCYIESRCPLLEYSVNNYPHFRVNFSGISWLLHVCSFICLFVTSSQMCTLALTKTRICVQKTWENGFEGFMVEATDQPLGQTSQFNTAFHIILWGVILGKQWAVYLLP